MTNSANLPAQRQKGIKTSYFPSRLFPLFTFFWGGRGRFDSGYSAINLVTYVYQNVKKKTKIYLKIFFAKKKKTGCVSVDCVKIYFHYINETHLGTCLFSFSFPSFRFKHLFPGVTCLFLTREREEQREWPQDPSARLSGPLSSQLRHLLLHIAIALREEKLRGKSRERSRGLYATSLRASVISQVPARLTGQNSTIPQWLVDKYL